MRDLKYKSSVISYCKKAQGWAILIQYSSDVDDDDDVVAKGRKDELKIEENKNSLIQELSFCKDRKNGKAPIRYWCGELLTAHGDHDDGDDHFNEGKLMMRIMNTLKILW